MIILIKRRGVIYTTKYCIELHGRFQTGLLQTTCGGMKTVINYSSEHGLAAGSLVLLCSKHGLVGGLAYCSVHGLVGG